MENNDQAKGNLNRRDIIRGLAALPVLGAFFLGSAAKKSYDDSIKEGILNELNVNASPPPPTGSMAGDPIRVGIIGFGIRGKQLMRALGFATPAWKESMRKAALNNPSDTRLKEFFSQQNLNIRIEGVCDVFDVRAEEAIEAGTVDGHKPRRFLDYRAMLDSPDIDAVVIATPDHWHAPQAMDAIRAGKHVYVEKCMTHKFDETYEMYDLIKDASPVFQLGHQHRQTQSFLTAQDIIKKNVLGHIGLVQTNTNRNSDNGAWQYPIHDKASPQTIDWQQFIGNAPEIPFNKEHFFRWRKWWAYGTGLASDLLTHDYDRINCVLNMGIPATVMASGGIYTHRDGRTVPDVFQVNMEFPDYFRGGSQEEGKERGMTFVYSATLGNQYSRPTLLMGHDATMELGNALFVYADQRSTRYADMLEKGTVKPGSPMYAYDPSAQGVDAVTSATAKYFANKGLLYTYRDGKRVDSTFLHMKEWLSAIRNDHPVSCGIQEGFEEAISALMACASYRLGKRIDWDPVQMRVANATDEELLSIGMMRDSKLAMM